MTNTSKQPAVWLIAMIAGLPLLSETVYTPSLPAIAKALLTSSEMVEYTLTVYLFGFALGVLLWGNVSDRVGRKPALLAGFGLYVFACVGCYLANTIETLMIFRFFQALGGSTGSVLGQAIARDAFHGSARGKVYASVSSALGLSPALGPILGGFITQASSWHNVFASLVLLGLAASLLIALRLPETHPEKGGVPFSSMFKTLRKMLCDKRVIGFGLLVGCGNGIMFSYYAEGSFYLIDILKLSPSQYGFTFWALSLTWILSGLLAKKLLDFMTGQRVIVIGLCCNLLGCLLFNGAIFSGIINLHDSFFSAMLTVAIICITFSGFTLVNTNSLSLALEHYQQASGTASSFFGFFYYGIVSLLTFGMGFLRDGSLMVMPLYFLGIVAIMIVVFLSMVREREESATD